MASNSLNILATAGSLNQKSVTRVVVRHVAGLLAADGCTVDILDLAAEPLALYNPETAHEGAIYAALKARVERADVILLGTPDYHGCVSGTTKNFLDHFWREFAGKLFATIVSSHEKGLTVTDQLRTVARQCYAWTLPYGISFTDGEDVRDGVVTGEAFKKKLAMFARDTRVYGTLLARQRAVDLAGTEPGFLERLRK